MVSDILKVNIASNIRMKLGVLLVFCCATLFQTACAAPALPFEVNGETGVVGEEIAEVKPNGDVMLKTPEPLKIGGMTHAASTAASDLNDTVDQAVSDHVLPDTQIPATKISMNTPSAPIISTIESMTPPLDNQLAPMIPAVAADLPSADRLLLLKIIADSIRQTEQLMQSMYSSLPASVMPSKEMLNAMLQTSNINPANDPSLKLVDQKIIDQDGVKGHISTYEGRPDPNTVAKMQTSHYSINKNGLVGVGTGNYYNSASASSSNGGTPAVSLRTSVSGTPWFSQTFPYLRFP